MLFIRLTGVIWARNSNWLHVFSNLYFVQKKIVSNIFLDFNPLSILLCICMSEIFHVNKCRRHERWKWAHKFRNDIIPEIYIRKTHQGNFVLFVYESDKTQPKCATWLLIKICKIFVFSHRFIFMYVDENGYVLLLEYHILLWKLKSHNTENVQTLKIGMSIFLYAIFIIQFFPPS